MGQLIPAVVLGGYSMYVCAYNSTFLYRFAMAVLLSVKYFTGGMKAFLHPFFIYFFFCDISLKSDVKK